MKMISYNLTLKASAFIALLILVCCFHATDLKGQASEVLYRVNAGGPQIDAEPIPWEADQAETSVVGTAEKGTPSPYLIITNFKTEDWAYGIASFPGSHPEYPTELFATERFSISRKRISQSWDFPVSKEGTYTVNLLFAETYSGAQKPGSRVFGIAIEGKVVNDSLDVAKETGGLNIPLVETYKVEVTDGNLDIDLLKRIQNPAIKGIEILGPAEANLNLPPRFGPLPVVRGEAGETLQATFTTLEKDGDPVTLEIIIKDQNGNTIDPSIYSFTNYDDGTGTLVWETKATDIFVYNATITATDKDGSVSKKFTITISEKVKNILYRVNAGGEELQDASDPSRPPFSADNVSTPGQRHSTNSPVTVDASVPAYVPLSLFQTESFRTDEMKWSFPVPEDTMVNIRIYLAEIFLTEESPTPRIFDIIINGDTVEKAINVLSEAGANVGIMRSYSVTSHGSVDILFKAISQNPSVKGIEIIKVTPLQVNITTEDALCFGDHGSAAVEVSGGIGPYEIIWGGGVTPNQLLAGTHTVTIRDASGQQKEEEITINQPEAFNVTITTENATSPDANDGKASATVSGGVEPYAYNWGEGVDPEALATGSYTLTVTDANGCSVTHAFIIGDPETFLVDVKTTNPLCFDGTGSAEVIISGGVAPYETVWKDGVDPAALPAGEYTVTVTDQTGTQVEEQVIITQPENELKVEVDVTDASAFGANDGSVSLDISGGTLPYNIFWGAITPNALPAGTYTVRVKDAAGCEKEVEIVIGQPKELIAEITTTDATCNEGGSATVDIQGGTFPYKVTWSNQANPDNLPAGTYQVVITDANDIRITKDIEIILDCDDPLSTDDPEAENLQLKLYPVPGDHILNIDVPTSVADKEGRIRIYTAYGQKILEQKVNTFNLHTVNISHLNEGTYLLEVTTKNTVLKSRFLIGK